MARAKPTPAPRKNTGKKPNALLDTVKKELGHLGDLHRGQFKKFRESLKKMDGTRRMRKSQRMRKR